MGAKVRALMYQVEEAPRSITDPCRDREGDMQSESEALPVVGSTRGINVGLIETKLDLIKEATKTIPTNEYQLPVYIFRTDLLTETMLDKVDDMLSSATIYLAYHHGYPTLKDEMPFWGQLEWEDKSAFAAFVDYLALEGARKLSDVVGYAADLRAKWFHEHYWAYRAHAFDLYQIAHHTRLKEKRIFEVEDSHWKASKKMFQRVEKALDGVTDAELSQMEPDKLVKMMETVAKIQRSAAGLQHQGDPKKDLDPKSTSVEVVMRKVAESSGYQASDTGEIDLTQVYSDPDALKVLQETIIKVTR